MTGRLRGSVALGTGVLLCAGAALAASVLPGTALADGALPPAGEELLVDPETGNNEVRPTFTTSAPCPSRTTETYVLLFGPDLPDDGQVIKDVGKAGLSTTEEFSVTASRSFQTTIEDAGSDELSGSYVVQLACVTSLGEQLETFTADLTFTSPTEFTAGPAPEPTPTASPSRTPSPGPSPSPTTEPTPSGGARAIDDSCPSDRVPEDGFTDVPASNTHEASIDCIVWFQVAQGTSSSTYNPVGQVTREQMATFIANLVTRTGGTLPDGPDRFADDNGSRHEANINRLSQAGIVGGRADGSYGPQQVVTRDQMATFLVRAYEFRSGSTLDAGPDAFTDDNGNVAHQGNINKAANAGFTGGTSGGGYNPSGPVRRDQMGSFLARVLDLLVEADGAPLPS